MKKVLLVFITILITAAVSACQATPDEPVVIQKDLEQMIEKATQTETEHNNRYIAGRAAGYAGNT